MSPIVWDSRTVQHVVGAEDPDAQVEHFGREDDGIRKNAMHVSGRAR
jgi:hypothetical protein